MPDMTQEQCNQLWQENKHLLLMSAHAAQLSYKDIEQEVYTNPKYNDLREPKAGGQQQRFVNVEGVSNRMLADAGKNYSRQISDANTNYDILPPIRVKNSNAIILIPEDKTQAVIVDFTGSNDRKDWQLNFAALPVYSKTTGTITHLGFDEMLNMEMKSPGLFAKAQKTIDELIHHKYHITDDAPGSVSFKDQIIQRLEAEIQAGRIGPNQPIVFSGHSMGGALAGMAAIDWVGRHPERAHTTKLVTFCAASLGHPTARKAEQLIGKDNCLTVCHPGDIVPVAGRSAAPGWTLKKQQDEQGQLVFEVEDRTNLMDQVTGKVAEFLRVGKNLKELAEFHSNINMLDDIKTACTYHHVPLRPEPTRIEKTIKGVGSAIETLVDPLEGLLDRSGQPHNTPPLGIDKPYYRGK